MGVKCLFGVTFPFSNLSICICSYTTCSLVTSVYLQNHTICWEMQQRKCSQGWNQMCKGECCCSFSVCSCMCGCGTEYICSRGAKGENLFRIEAVAHWQTHCHTQPVHCCHSLPLLTFSIMSFTRGWALFFFCPCAPYHHSQLFSFTPTFLFYSSALFIPFPF